MGYWKTSKMRLVSLIRNEGHDNLGSSTCFRCFQFLTSSWFEKQPFSGAKLAACMFAGIINGINFFSCDFSIVLFYIFVCDFIA